MRRILTRLKWNGMKRNEHQVKIKWKLNVIEGLKWHEIENIWNRKYLKLKIFEIEKTKWKMKWKRNELEVKLKWTRNWNDARPGEPTQLSEDDEAENSAGRGRYGFSPPRRKAFQGHRSYRRRRRGACACMSYASCDACCLVLLASFFLLNSMHLYDTYTWYLSILILILINTQVVTHINQYLSTRSINQYSGMSNNIDMKY